MKTKLVAIIGAALLCGCAGTKVITEETVSQRTTTRFDPYKRVQYVDGPVYQFTLFPNDVRVLLRGMLPKESPELLQLYVTFGAREWAFLERANDIEGHRFDLVQIDRQVPIGGGGQIVEHVAINLDHDYLQKRRDSGLDFKLIGRREEFTVQVPAGYVQGFLASYDAVKASKP